MKKICMIASILLSEFCVAQLNFEWATSAGGASVDITHSSDLDPNGNFYSTGVFTSSGDFNPGIAINTLTSQGNFDVFIQKLDLNGNYVWAKSLGSTGDDRGNDLIVSSTGNIYITGSFQGTVDFDPGVSTFNLTSAGSEDMFLLKLDASGNFVWATSLGTASADKGFSVREDSQNNVFVAGYQGTNCFIQKYNASGISTWNKTITLNTASNKIVLGIDNADNIYLTGGFMGTIDADPGVGSINHISAGGLDIFYLKLDNNGNYMSSQSVGSTSTDLARNIIFDSNNNMILIGSFSSTVDFNSGIGVENATSVGQMDMFILKLNSSGGFIWNKTIGGTAGDAPIGISIDFNNDIYVSGEFGETADFNPSVGVFNLTAAGTGGGMDVFGLKLKSNGDFSWAFSFGEVDADDSGASINVTSTGEVYLSGLYRGTVDFNIGSGTFNQTSISNSADIFQLKITQCLPTSITPDLSLLSNLTAECAVNMPLSPTASNCSGTYNGIPDVSFPITSQGTTVITWTYDDGNGNTTTQTQNVIIDDVTAPVADVTTLSNITSECEITSLTAPTAQDNCAGTITGTHNATLPITSSTTLTWTYNDGNGNTSTQTQNVNITPINSAVTQVNPLTLMADASGYTYQWIDCNNANQPITGETNQSFTASVNGNYAVIISNNNCSDTSTCISINSVGIKSFTKEHSINIYPNPSTGLFTIQGLKINDKIEVYNVIGEKVFAANTSNTKVDINLTMQPNGIYFIKTSSNQVLKLVKE